MLPSPVNVITSEEEGLYFKDIGYFKISAEKKKTPQQNKVQNNINSLKICSRYYFPINYFPIILHPEFENNH